MKRLRQFIFNALAVLSLLLCVATVGLWARSYTRGDGVAFALRRGWTLRVTSYVGRIYVLADDDWEHFVARGKWTSWKVGWKRCDWDVGDTPSSVHPHCTDIIGTG